MIIDIHNHAHYHAYSVEKMIENMDQNHIDLTCLLSWEAPSTEYDPNTKFMFSPLSDLAVPFEACLSYKNAAPDRFLLGYCPDPRKPDSIHRLKAATQLFDLSMCGELKLRMMYDNPDAIRLYRVCGELGLPVLMHFDYEYPSQNIYPWPNYWYGGGIDVLTRLPVSAGNLPCAAIPVAAENPLSLCAGKNDGILQRGILRCIIKVHLHTFCFLFDSGKAFSF